MDNIDIDYYEENIKIKSLIRHIVYSSWQDLELYDYIEDIEIETSEDEIEEDQYYVDDYIDGKKNKWW